MENKICTADVWAIQKYPEEAETAIDSMIEAPEKSKKKRDVFVNGCVSRLQLGDKRLLTRFNAAYFSDNKDTLIMLMQGGEMTPDRFCELLAEKGLTDYVSIKSSSEREYPHEQDNKEIWFAREQYVLADALTDSKDKGIDTCEYYHNVRGNLVLEFPMDIKLATLPIRGVIILEDKIVLILDQQLEENLKFEDVIKTFNDHGIAASIKREDHLPDGEEYKKLIKE